MAATVVHHFEKYGLEGALQSTLGYSARLGSPAEAAGLASVMSARPDLWFDIRHPYQDDPAVVWFRPRTENKPEKPARRFAGPALFVWVVFFVSAPIVGAVIANASGHPGFFQAALWLWGIWGVFAVAYVTFKPDERKLMQRRIDLLIAEAPGIVES